jgi:hypothetical protein
VQHYSYCPLYLPSGEIGRRDDSGIIPLKAVPALSIVFRFVNGNGISKLIGKGESPRNRNLLEEKKFAVLEIINPLSMTEQTLSISSPSVSL